jgi:hypothetical protein
MTTEEKSSHDSIPDSIITDILDYGLVVKTPRSADSILLGFVMDEYGSDKVAETIGPLFSKLVDNTGKKYREMWGGDGERGEKLLNLYAAFLESYKQGSQLTIEEKLVFKDGKLISRASDNNAQQ